MRALGAVVAAAALGVLSSTAFEPLEWRYTMVLAVAGLFLLLRGLREARTRLVVAVGLAYGAGFFYVLIWWMRAVSDGAYIALALAETLFLGVLAIGLRATLVRRFWWITAPGVWVFGEWARSSFPFTGFPWGRLAHSAIDTPFAPYARLIGMPGTSAVLLFLACALVALVVGGRRARVTGAATIVALTVIGLVLPVGIAGAGETKKVALIQGDVPGVFLTWPRGAIFDLHAAETEKLADRVESGESERPDMVLWPENATDEDPLTTADVRFEIESLSARIGAPILVGGIFDGPRPDTAYNAGVVWTENGPGDRYIKRKPVPYGEYVPFRDSLEGIVPRFDRDIPRNMLAGDLPGALDIGGAVLGDTICYDIVYDGVIRDSLAEGAQAIVVQTSNAAFTGTSQPEQQWDISRLRALETGRYVLVPSTNGISGIVGPDGQVVERAPLHEPATIERTITLADGKTPSATLGLPVEVLLIVVGLVGWAYARFGGDAHLRRGREPRAGARRGADGAA